MQACMNDECYVCMNECMNMYETYMTIYLWDWWDTIGQVNMVVARHHNTNTQQSSMGTTSLKMSQNTDRDTNPSNKPLVGVNPNNQTTDGGKAQ